MLESAGKCVALLGGGFFQIGSWPVLVPSPVKSTVTSYGSFIFL